MPEPDMDRVMAEVASEPVEPLWWQWRNEMVDERGEIRTRSSSSNRVATRMFDLPAN